MTLTPQLLAGGAGWRALDVWCDAGPADAPFEEQHDSICMAIVLTGTFSYRSSRGASTLAPGAVLLGNPGDCFECGHQHSVGDRCLSFQFDPAFYESILAVVPGAARLPLETPALPPHARRAHLLPQADAALDDPTAVEEFAYELAGCIAATVVDASPDSAPRCRNTGRIEELVHWIERDADQKLPLTGLARQAGMSPFHLLREFKRVVGMSPHQFVLAQRLRRAARRLRQSDDPVLTVAIEAGFSDLSEFNRRFRRVLGVTPTAFRARRGRRA